MEVRDQGSKGQRGLTANLLNDDIDLIAVLHVQVLGGLVLVESFAVEQETDVVDVELAKMSVTLCLWQ